CLPALTGAWRYRGGGILYLTSRLQFKALNAGDVLAPEPDDPTIREINMVQIGRALTDPELDPPIKALIVWSSNPATIAPNQQLAPGGVAPRGAFHCAPGAFPPRPRPPRRLRAAGHDAARAPRFDVVVGSPVRRPQPPRHRSSR